MGAKEKALDLLKKNVGKIVLREEITKITGTTSWPRQVRFLRKEGWDIGYVTKPRGYILRSLKKKKGIRRAPISQKQRYRILKRNGHRCRSCGKGPDDGVKLQVDHKVPVDMGGKKHYENGELQTYCEECNLGKKHFYSDFDREEIEKILSLKTGGAKIEALFKYREGKPIRWEVPEALSGIRDWERTLRYLRQKKGMDIVWSKKTKTYTYKGNKNNKKK